MRYDGTLLHHFVQIQLLDLYYSILYLCHELYLSRSQRPGMILNTTTFKRSRFRYWSTGKAL